MTSAVEKILTGFKKLSPDEQEQVRHSLFEEELHPDWIPELYDRSAKYESGEDSGVPADTFYQEVQRRHS